MRLQMLLCLFLLAMPDLWAQGTFRLVPVANRLSLPSHITHAGDNSGRIFIVEQGGRVRILNNGSVSPTPFLDIAGRISCCVERGLLSIAFPPGYAGKNRFYVNYTNLDGDTVISMFLTTSNPDVADPDSEVVLLTVGQPFAEHNGGLLSFGPDGNMYVAVVDGLIEETLVGTS
jgi:glucose/arabinose dehydrogenase